MKMRILVASALTAAVAIFSGTSAATAQQTPQYQVGSFPINELGVRYVLEGSARKVADRVRITGQLIDAATGAHVWAERYDRRLEDIFACKMKLP